MFPLAAQRIVIGITGGIAAYKTIEVIRELQRRGYAHIDTILTRNALQFVTPVTIEAITGKVPHTDTFEPGRALSHIDLVQPCGLMAVVPATANILAKFAGGIGDDLLSTTYLAADCPVLVVPSMNTRMMDHVATQRNLKQLRQDGVHILEPEEGYLACGTYGKGRMPEIAVIVDEMERLLHAPHGTMAGVRVLIVSGGTSEPIDPVRTITNRSTGRMGAELARAFRNAGADVRLVTGTGTTRYPMTSVHHEVETAAQMAEAVFREAETADVIIMAAAVADYTPASPSTEKRKKTDEALSLVLKPTEDILKALGQRFGGSRILVGFAAETADVATHAKMKLDAKGADLIVGNRVGAPDTGFGAETNEAVLVTRDGSSTDTGCIAKEALAVRIVKEVERLRESRHG